MYMDNLFFREDARVSQWKRIVFATNNAETIGYSVAPKFFPGGSACKQSASNARDLDSTPGLERYPGEGNSNPLQNDCLEYSMEFNPYLTLCTKINLGIP